MSPTADPSPSQRLASLRGRFERGEPQAWITAYDFPQGRLLDEAGVDLLLCGDSLGMVVLGLPDTVEVTMEDMVRHTAAVARGRRRAFLLADLPHGADATPERAVAHARRLVAAGADGVKLEGASAKAGAIAAIVAAGIPFCGHLGMLPQSVRQEGGYHKKGKAEAEAAMLVAEALRLEQLGAFAIVLESVAAPAAERMAETVGIPCIGIGTGKAKLAGQIRVIHDVVGAFPWFVPPFANPHADQAALVAAAAAEFVARARTGSTNP